MQEQPEVQCRMPLPQFPNDETRKCDHSLLD
jgi:hypothetical protein